MSYGKPNIGIRHLDCSLVTDCWRTDLVIKSCGGDYVVDMDPTVIEKLKERYSDDHDVGVFENYQEKTRIRLIPPRGEHVNHIEVDVPPSCYVVGTRICHGGNEETDNGWLW